MGEESLKTVKSKLIVNSNDWYLGHLEMGGKPNLCHYNNTESFR